MGFNTGFDPQFDSAPPTVTVVVTPPSAPAQPSQADLIAPATAEQRGAGGLAPRPARVPEPSPEPVQGAERHHVAGVRRLKE